jgi:hypothetical protein
MSGFDLVEVVQDPRRAEVFSLRSTGRLRGRRSVFLWRLRVELNRKLRRRINVAFDISVTAHLSSGRSRPAASDMAGHLDRENR